MLAVLYCLEKINLARLRLLQNHGQAQASELLTGRPTELAEQFGGLLWRDLMVSLLLGVDERPNAHEIAGRARDATAAFLQLHALLNVRVETT
jgi:hypothetical protein